MRLSSLPHPCIPPPLSPFPPEPCSLVPCGAASGLPLAQG